MSEKSFYSLDHLIEINEKRAHEYASSHQKVQERLTHLIIIFSGVTIFLIPIIKLIIKTNGKNYILNYCFGIFAILFVLSLWNTIRLIMPVKISYLNNPKYYYMDIRLEYKQANMSNNTNLSQEEIDALIKASYISELEESVEYNYKLFLRKSSFYFRALIFGLLCVLPFLVCVGYHISEKDDSIQKVLIVN